MSELHNDIFANGFLIAKHFTLSRDYCRDAEGIMELTGSDWSREKQQDAQTALYHARETLDEVESMIGWCVIHTDLSEDCATFADVTSEARMVARQIKKLQGELNARKEDA